MYVGITGTFAAGKGEVVRILKRHGFVHYSFGDMLRQLCRDRGLDTSIPTLTRVGNELRQQHGPSYIAEQLLHKIEVDAPKHAVFESIRTLAELNTLRRLPGFVLLSLDAPREMRFERLKARGRHDNLHTFEEFVHWEDQQLEGGQHEQHILAVMEKADVQIVNIGNLEELEEQIREALTI